MDNSNFKIEIKKNIDALITTVTIYELNNRLFSRQLNALSDEFLLSSSGDYFVIQLLGSNHIDSNKCFLFNTKTGVEIFGKQLDCGIPKGYFFDNNDKLFASTKYGDFEIDLNGNVINLEQYYRNCLYVGEADAIFLAKKYLHHLNYSDKACNIVLDSMNTALLNQFKEFHGGAWGAEACKIKGEIFELNSMENDALQSYMDAVYLNKNIAVKRKINTLCKKLGLSKDSLKASSIVERLLETNIALREAKMEESRKMWEKFL